ncbi:capsular polysaccharide biosynthesis protein [Chitinilyticum piscinae]|uniref:capsular polysaccharide biosynthesis protein n=1 Tax=Chitinilyticum piscinae TaxID=2866724 RepID=UPI001D164982|nr:capsular polysaccharide biosynthesis protein [Chitinilyticum piscinae]
MANQQPSHFLALSKPVFSQCASKGLLPAPLTLYRPGKQLALGTTVIGWGLKPSAAKARLFAEMKGLNFITVEDGFLRSVGIGQGELPLSLVLDDLGIYYDCRNPSRLEALIAMPLTAIQHTRAQALRQHWCAGAVSKYNHQRIVHPTLPRGFILVVDQTYGDAAIEFGGASADTFERMLNAALAENAGSPVVLKIHPEVLAGRKRGHFSLEALRTNPRIILLADDIHPAELLPLASQVYVVTSQMGFDALLWGVPVRCFGMPFYAGWGLTSDDLPAPSRRSHANLEQLIHAALIAYPRYVDPETQQTCEVEVVLAHLALQRRMRSRLPNCVQAYGFSKWKRPIVQDFTWGSQVDFLRWKRWRRKTALPMLIWGKKHLEAFPDTEYPDIQTTTRISVEDGFIRSVGLGADLIRPVSWVFDSRGIYFDASRPSDLEHLLEHVDMDDALLLRARRLRERIVAEKLTKYNVGTGSWQRPNSNKPVVLVAGQVESDASIRYGAGQIRSNIGLLQAVRTAQPEAWIVYKPHPDVLAGLRERGQNEDEALHWCDELVTDMPMADMLTQVDAVHVLTSLTGFEALLRGVQVEVWGMPFYSGWGLTHDHMQCNRRTRLRNLDELVAAALILYPVYVSRITGRYTTPERALDELISWRQSKQAALPWWRLALRKLLPYV